MLDPRSARRRSTTSTSGSGRASPRCRSRASSAPTAPASSRRSATASTASSAGDRVVINPGLEHGDADHGRRRAHRRHARRADRRPGDERPSAPGRARRSRTPPRSRSCSRPRTGCSSTQASAAGGRVGARLGHRQRRRDRALAIAKALGATRARRPLRATRSSRGRASSAPTRPSTTRPDDVVAGVKAAHRRRRGRRGRARRRGDVEALSRRRRPAGRGSSSAARRRAEPAGQLHRIWWKQLSVLGSTMGSRADFEAPTSSSQPAARRRSSTGVPARGGRGRARAARARRAVRQDRAAIPGCS